MSSVARRLMNIAVVKASKKEEIEVQGDITELPKLGDLNDLANYIQSSQGQGCDELDILGLSSDHLIPDGEC